MDSTRIDDPTSGLAADSPEQQFRRFIAATWKPEDIIEVRLIHRCRPGAKSLWFSFDELQGQHSALAGRTAKGFGIYAGINPRPRGEKGDKSVLLARTLFADFDNGVTPARAVEMIRNVRLPDPSVVVSSGHGTHAYWRLREPTTDMDRWRAAMKYIVGLLGTDRKIVNQERVMRLPGFDNVKSSPVPCKLVQCDETQHELELLKAKQDTGSLHSGRSARSEQSDRSVKAMPPFVFSVEDIENAICMTVPDGERQRNRKIFDFARRLKGMMPDAPKSELKELVRQWHSRALPFIRTKGFDMTWAEFLTSWKRTRKGAMLEPYEVALRTADAAEPPASAMQYEDPQVRRLVGWCREMQRASEETFFLATRVIGRLLGISHTQAGKWMFMLEEDGILSMVSQGNRVTAPHYNYVAADLLPAEPLEPETTPETDQTSDAGGTVLAVQENYYSNVA